MRYSSGRTFRFHVTATVVTFLFHHLAEETTLGKWVDVFWFPVFITLVTAIFSLSSMFRRITIWIPKIGTRHSESDVLTHFMSAANTSADSVCSLANVELCDPNICEVV